MAAVRVGRNDLCPCGSGRKFKRCCAANGDVTGTSDTAFETPWLIPGDGGDGLRTTPQPRMQREDQGDRPIKRIPVHYTYPEPFGETECVYCFPVEQIFLLEVGGTVYVGSREAGSALVHNGMGDCFKRPAVPTVDDIIKGIQAPGKFDATVASEAEARRMAQTALPHATELPPTVAGQPYPSPPTGVKAWLQVHPPDATPGSGVPNLPHVKYADWTGGKRGRGGSWGHIFFPL
jgi:hypothetical protein